MNRNLRFAIDVVLISGLVLVIVICGHHYREWQYWLLFGYVWVYGFIQWVLGFQEGDK